MGQFYKGTKATFLDDAMFKLPYELIGKVIEKKDKEVNDSISTLTAYNDKLKADVLEEDNPQARAKIKEYQQRIDGAIQNIQSDAMNYNQVLPEIKKISRDLTKDWDPNGIIGSMESNKKSFLKEKERIADLVKAGKLDPFIATQEEAKIREKYKADGGLKWNKESDKPENSLDLQDQYYNLDFDEKFLEHMKPDEWSSEYDTDAGMFIYTNKNSGKSLTRDDIIQTYITELQADTPNMYAASRYGQLGGEEGLPGYEGVNKIGEAVYYEDSKDKKGNPIRVLKTNQNNYWGRKAEAAARVFEQNERNTSQTMQNNTYRQKLAEEERNKPEEIIIDHEVAIGTKNHSAQSSIGTWSINNASITSLKTELGGLAKANGIKEGTPEYTAIMSGDPAAIKAMFTDPKTAEKYIDKYNNVNMEINLQKGAINKFNSQYAKELKTLGNNGKGLSENPANWTPAQQAFYDKKMGERETIIYNKGKATFNGAEMTSGTQEEVKKSVESHILMGTGTFTAVQGIPSIKLGGARVRYLDPNNRMYATDLTPSRKVAVTYKGKVYYFSGHPASNTYNIGGKAVTVDPKDILVTYPSPGGEVNMNYYAQNGHVLASQVMSNEDDKGTKVMAFQTVEGGKLVSITVDKENTAPSYLLDNKKENFIKSGFKIGSQGIDVTVKGITTPKLQKAWDDTYEQRNIETTKVKYGNSYEGTTPGPKGTTYRVSTDSQGNAQYFIDSQTRTGQPVTDPAVIYAIDKAILYKRN
jgi:hypothetical protein